MTQSMQGTDTGDSGLKLREKTLSGASGKIFYHVTVSKVRNELLKIT